MSTDDYTGALVDRVLNAASDIWAEGNKWLVRKDLPVEVRGEVAAALHNAADHVRDAIRDPNLVGLVPVGPDAIPGPPSPPRPKNDRPYA